ncbi:unnamed protein product [Caenorhabditis angaria]|uniref:Acyl_transf_3 domain-containing protein n=1 Tax=Caenorhabditis angaria TaxID=860376 RepID=A0A9P1ILF6_9PELO|nr:unnamed protein product [Caenorhabditis angaria]
MKRLDLQGLRGLSILAVLGFHFFPKYFPNGFYGVDQFFVLSGYLMCMLLTKSENLPKSKFFSNFYMRRFRRIIPLYQFVILTSLILANLLFYQTTLRKNEESALKAIFFASNQLKPADQNYFAMLLNSIDIFTHTWSLSVEIQFYILAPFLFLSPAGRMRIVVMGGVLMVSFCWWHFLPGDVAFLDVFARIWQFLIGMLVFIAQPEHTNQPINIEKSEEATPKNKILTTSTTIFLMLIIFCPKPLDSRFFRPLITSLTGLLILLSETGNILLENRILVYFGDISYSLYLIHWPILCFFKDFSLISALLISIFLAILVYQFFEKWYLKLSNFNIFALSVILILANLVVSNQRIFLSSPSAKHIDLLNMNRENLLAKRNISWREVDEQNREWNNNDEFNLNIETCRSGTGKWDGWCNHTGLSGENGKNNKKYKVILIGNSWAANHGKMIYDVCWKKMNIFVQGSYGACEPLFPASQHQCTQKYIDDFEKHIQDLNPDYVFHVTRHISYGQISNEKTIDTVYQAMLNQTKRLLKYIKRKIYFVNAIPTVNTPELYKLANRIRKNESFVEIDKTLFEPNNYEIARNRYEKLKKDCGEKCELVDYFKLFYRNDTKTFRFFDENGIELLTNGKHLSQLGLELVKPIWKGICDSF